MALSIEKTKARAAKLGAKGKWSKAAQLYAQLAEIDAKNPRWPQKEGEMYRKWGKNKLAIERFEIAVRSYAKEGFLLKAVALCQLILGLDPEHAEAQDLLTKMSGDPERQAQEKIELPQLELKQSAGDVLVSTSPEPGLLDTLSLKAMIPDARAVGDEPQEDTFFEIPLTDGQLDEAFDDMMTTSPNDDLVGRVKPIPLFSALEGAALLSLIRKVEVHSYEPGELIIVENTQGTSLFVLVEGEVLIYTTGPPKATLGHLTEGAFFGEIALLTAAKRSATVKAINECLVLEISRELVATLVRQHPDVLKVLLAFFRERLIDSMSDTSPLFQAFTGPERARLTSQFTFVEVEIGAVLQQRGRPATALYALLCGEAQAISMGGTDTLARGSLVGAASMLTSSPATATVVATKRCWLLKLEGDTFREVILTHPHVLGYLSGLDDRGRIDLAEKLEHPTSGLLSLV
jgi:CRP-like cAMP-binding protein